MTHTRNGAGEATDRPGWPTLARVLLGCAAVGAALAGVVTALVLTDWAPLVTGLLAAVVVMTLLRVFRGGRIPVPETPEPVARLALARIESRRATGSEGPDIPVEMDLTVAPDDAPAFRVRVTRDVNLVDLPDCRVGAILVVRYRPGAEWNTEVVDRPDGTWARRAATGTVDSAPEETRVATPPMPWSSCLLALAGVLAGAAAIALVFGLDLV
jgi:hypothetical protein